MPTVKIAFQNQLFDLRLGDPNLEEAHALAPTFPECATRAVEVPMVASLAPEELKPRGQYEIVNGLVGASTNRRASTADSEGYGPHFYLNPVEVACDPGRLSRKELRVKISGNARRIRSLHSLRTPRLVQAGRLIVGPTANSPGAM